MWVLAGEWRRFVVGYWTEEESAVNRSVQSDTPLLLQDYGQGWSVVPYVALGYTTSDMHNRTINDGIVIERRWSQQGKRPSTSFQFVDPESIFDANAIEQLRQVGGETMVISAWSSTLGKLHRIAPEALEPLGNVTAVLHLERLAEKLRSN
jgi:hypothetical protein